MKTDPRKPQKSTGEATSPAVEGLVLSRELWRQISSKLKGDGVRPVSRQGAKPCAALTGRLRNGIFLIQGWRPTSRPTPADIPLYIAADPARLAQPSPASVLQVIAVWSGKGKAPPQFYRPAFSGDPIDEVFCIVFDPHADPFASVEGIFDTRVLEDKTVTIIGLGSFGSFCAEQLVRNAVLLFRLVDFDRLEPRNIARHIGVPDDLGQYKTVVTAERLRAINPRCKIRSYEADITQSPQVLQSAVRGSDLVLVCTDNNPSRYHINACCLRLGVPAVYAGAYERAFGGMVLRVIPGQTPCYDCVYGNVLKTLGAPPSDPSNGPIPYSQVQNATELKAEPGLSIDAHMITLIQAKMALLTLLRDTETSLDDFPRDLIFWGNRKQWIFPEPLYCKFAQTTFRHDCFTCNSIKLKKKDREAYCDRAQTIIQSAQLHPDIFGRKEQ